MTASVSGSRTTGRTGRSSAAAASPGSTSTARRVLELGWVVRDALTGRGYATEIGRAALEWAAAYFPHLPVVSFTEVHNRASEAVMRRLGMRDAGVIYREGLNAGRPGLHPDAPFALYRND